MKKRIITAIVAIIIFAPICYFSEKIIFPIAMGILAAVGVFEISKCIGFHKKIALTLPIYIVALTLPLLRFFLDSDTKPNSVFMLYAMASVFFLTVYALVFAIFTKNKYKLSNVLTLIALSVYVIGCFSSIVMIRYTDAVDKQGIVMFPVIFVSAWVCDTFAYFVGRFFGKHKLIPEISPKKTIEGAIGGVVFTLITLIAYGCILRFGFGYKEIHLLHFAILGLVLPVVSQIGDLVASCIKRQYEIKDFGNVFPGHGGVLDRFDSPMLVAPFLCLTNAIVFQLF